MRVQISDLSVRWKLGPLDLRHFAGLGAEGQTSKFFFEPRPFRRVYSRGQLLHQGQVVARFEAGLKQIRRNNVRAYLPRASDFIQSIRCASWKLKTTDNRLGCFHA